MQDDTRIRIGDMESQLHRHAGRIEKFEHVLGSANETPRSRTSEKNLAMEKQLEELQEQIIVLCAEAASTQQEPIKVMMVGGLQDSGVFMKLPDGLMTQSPR